MLTSHQQTIVHLAICSRAAVITLSFLSNLVVPDHNASDVFIYRNEEIENEGICDKVVHVIFGGLFRWDANYFIHISHYGYSKENMVAFFPLFPFIVRLLASFIYLFIGSILTYSSVLLITSVFVNYLLFIKCTLLLYDLSIKILKHERSAYYAAVAFTVNPASIFFTAPYSETLYTFLTFSIMINSVNDRFILASMIAGLSCSARSNGVLNIGFILYNFIVFFIRHFSLTLHYFLSALILLIVFLIMSLAPFCLFQLYAYVKFCLDYRISPSHMNSVPSSWCNETIPLAYSYVQKHYWNVGFLEYYQLKQIPNFLLALPIIYIILYNSLKKIKTEKILLNKIFYDGFNVILEIKNNQNSTINKLNYLVFIIHASALTVFCLLFVHVQISTRMLCSSSPVFYWFIADYFITNNVDNKFSRRLDTSNDLSNMLNKKSVKFNYDNEPLASCHLLTARDCWKIFFCDSKCSDGYLIGQFFVKLYFVNYFILGTVLFSNFYPWT